MGASRWAFFFLKAVRLRMRALVPFAKLMVAVELLAALSRDDTTAWCFAYAPLGSGNF